MKKKKVFKVLLWVFSITFLLVAFIFVYAYYNSKPKYTPSENKFTTRVAYINPENSLLSEGFEVCSERIVDYYNYQIGQTKGQVASYSKGKNGLRKHVLSHYKNKGYSDSGYLNIRFVINCKGETGRYIIHENNLDLEPKKFNKDLVNQLFNITTQLKKWNPVIYGEDNIKDSYMYISYRIENGEITEILP